MIRDKPLHNFLFESDESGFYDNIEIFCTPWIDMCVILTLIKKFKPQSFLEIGTHKGYTTRNIKRKFPHLSITTIDPGDKVPLNDRPPNQHTEYLPQSEIGCLLGDYPDIRILKDRFEDINFSGKNFDFIFIDGNHNYDHVIKDTRLALELINKGGIIVWHDFNNVKAVNDAVATFATINAITLHNTWVGYCEIN